MASLLFAFILSTLLVIHSRRKKSLTVNGSAGAFLLGMVTFSSSYWLFTVALLTFFITSSKLTKVKAERKRQLEEDYDLLSERNLIQVLCNGLIGGIAVSLFHAYGESTQCYDLTRWGKVLLWIYIGHYSCCAGDTWASELGILNKSDPFLITTGKRVQPGVNGAVSPLGLAASLGGGITIGIVSALSLLVDQRCSGFAWDLVVLGSLAGLGGSLVDSLLGATVQETLYSKDKHMVVSSKDNNKDTVVVSGWNILDNHQVNLLSSFITSGLCGLVAYYTY
ncbi:integral membrane protein DUF92-domain-containing protein [Cunninghamella echinulata]|nr:integral membrane protein DUF92-domain-containing protein [Cunninghamella echinulata]